LASDGYYVRPTLFAEVTNDMTIAREEIFGPVLSMLTYRDENHAIEIANDTDYGLHAYVFSSDPARARRVSRPVGWRSTSPWNPSLRSGDSSSRALGENTAPTALRPFSNQGLDQDKSVSPSGKFSRASWREYYVKTRRQFGRLPG
jgi:hypothetical protein